MSKLRIGVVVHLDDEPADGGGYSYINTLLQGINKFTFSPEIEIINIIFYKGQIPNTIYNKPVLFIKARFRSSLKQIGKRISKKTKSTTFTKRNPVIKFLYFSLLRYHNQRVEYLLQKNRIDLVYYLKQQEDILNYPFIATVWDVSHKSTNGFPEHTMNNNYEFREKYYSYTLNKAFIILSESQSGAEELKRYYSFYDQKIKVLPIFPSNIINHNVSPDTQNEILKKYDLEKEKFFIYPAQFWPHKNHYNLIIAFHKLVTDRNEHSLKLILSGSDKGNFTYIQELIKSLNLTSQVITPGFVSDDDLFTFYCNAIALAMPSFLGPTNLPLIEAAALKCAVICSDHSGHKELLRNNALYFDPSDFTAITNAMKQVLEITCRNKLREEGYLYAKESPFNIDNSLKVLNSILLETKSKRKTWGTTYSL